jgi:hypothetical protein
MDEKQTLSVFGWIIGTVIVSLFVLNAISLSIA